MRLGARKRYLIRFCRENRQWYSLFKAMAAERCRCSVPMIAMVLHGRRVSKPGWDALLWARDQMEAVR